MTRHRRPTGPLVGVRGLGCRLPSLWVPTLVRRHRTAIPCPRGRNRFRRTPDVSDGPVRTEGVRTRDRPVRVPDVLGWGVFLCVGVVGCMWGFVGGVGCVCCVGGGCVGVGCRCVGGCLWVWVGVGVCGVCVCVPKRRSCSTTKGRPSETRVRDSQATSGPVRRRGNCRSCRTPWGGPSKGHGTLVETLGVGPFRPPARG